MVFSVPLSPNLCSTIAVLLFSLQPLFLVLQEEVDLCEGFSCQNLFV